MDIKGFNEDLSESNDWLNLKFYNCSSEKGNFIQSETEIEIESMKFLILKSNQSIINADTVQSVSYAHYIIQIGYKFINRDFFTANLF